MIRFPMVATNIQSYFAYFFSTMGRKKLPPGAKKSNAQLCKEKRERKIKKIGWIKFHKDENKRKKISNKRVKETQTEDEYEHQLAKGRERGARFRARQANPMPLQVLVPPQVGMSLISNLF